MAGSFSIRKNKRVNIIVKIEEYLKSLPSNIMIGDNIRIPDKSIRSMFRLIDLNKSDIFYHLGCGMGNPVVIASEEFNVKKSIGIDIDKRKIKICNSLLTSKDDAKCSFSCNNILTSQFDDATVILFWFTEPEIIREMMLKFKNLKRGCKIITIWGPLIGCIPDKVEFPYIINYVPFKKANNLEEQIFSIFGVKCIDFLTSCKYAERYTKSLTCDSNRLLIIIQAVIIWINAKNFGVACGDTIPQIVKKYIKILHDFYDIEVKHLLK